ncbi:DNA polymerase beta superfamily protein [Nocardiopsis changdeensis]|uniref:Nucleotidyltransferase domain-containing protein n=1 Tax=Nocardiopsis changdeensis TaxID=2831969 RepID=A0ABX8BWG1_9ACTN|nr:MULTISPECIES: nucleotidyltransferase domain-containing protein [Nocardiopsis]QUX25123.1 nucleotidyltransferase domain-containing protein [Nocardiopsis changdeensis]QYX35510.1 nucleotidyltransferase domain-containing protein [Nocardiopsis sp. MT53]
MKHASPEFAEIAAKHTVLRCQVGSGVHGLGLPGQNDRDEMGICVEPPEYVIGLRGFEQYMYRSQDDHVRSGPGDLDLTVYSLRKWMRLALDGNPTVLLPLFVPEDEIVGITDTGRDLRSRADRIVSRSAGRRFLGYLRAQRDRLEGTRGGKHTNRPELVEQHGFDTKFAYHMVRLGLQGVELMETGRITLPMPADDREWLLALRRGEHTRAEALARAGELEERLAALCESADLPEEPDTAWADAWLVDAYRRSWDRG